MPGGRTGSDNDTDDEEELKQFKTKKPSFDDQDLKPPQTSATQEDQKLNTNPNSFFKVQPVNAAVVIKSDAQDISKKL